MKFLRKNKKYFGLMLITVISFGFVFSPLIVLADPTPAQIQTAQANASQNSSWVGQVVSWLTGKTLLFMSSAISMMLGGFFGMIIGLEAQIIDYILSPNNFSLVHTPIVDLGWGITRDLANMFFILILLIIAFATVLRIKSWAIQQLWWKVVAAALLINFSLVIAGFVIDFTNILTQFFLNQITGGGIGTMTTKLAASMQILNFYNPAPPESVGGAIGQFAASGFAAVAGIILTLVGLVVTAFVFGAAMIFLVVRILNIWLLLIFAPIVWMLWILPATSSYFSQWWHKFLHWTFFAPIFVFMIYLSLSIFDKTGQLSPKAFGVFPAAWKTAAPGLTTVGMPAAIFQWILVIGLMFGSLIVAQKFGVEGARAAIGATKGASKATALWGIRSYGRTAIALGTAAAGVGAGHPPGILRTITSPIRGVGTGLQAIGGVATGARGGRITAPLRTIPNNPLRAITQGAMAGSGLFKQTMNVYECQNCHNTIQSRRMPTINCPTCGATAVLTPGLPHADWRQV